ncbi:mitochondrial import inner membrane translocase subunit Tim29 [Pygocentrus nattereri]|uniref:Translocase of inner mitochondrial membrane 29 n=1 Tax=Pygocentrus nattereri TaxID=42514 RepID=A0AAR2LSV3_PYGNA|nr:mitochondrial import inner membrane translocase subunit Tim29 [Pygocentrus nattereri]
MNICFPAGAITLAVCAISALRFLGSPCFAERLCGNSSLVQFLFRLRALLRRLDGSMAASCVLRRFCSAAAAAQSKATRWERLKNSRVGTWCHSLLGDYKEACREVFVGARERPVKATVYAALVGGMYACYRTNPDDTSFQTDLLETSNKLALLSPWIRSGTSDGHVQNLVKLRNQGRLRHLSLGLASLTYVVDFDHECSLYEAQCSALSVPWAELAKRVLDVGFAGRWWVLDHKMKDYDINEEEFKHLPSALAATGPPTAQETERNERLHKESWKPLVMEVEEETTVAMDSVRKEGEITAEGKERNA